VADDDGEPGVLIFVYTASSTGRTLQPSAEGDLVWVPRLHVLDYDLVPDLRQLLPRLLAGDDERVLYGHYGAGGIRFRTE
jgi:hypothetical protein